MRPQQKYQKKKPWIKTEESRDGLVLEFGGAWTFQTLSAAQTDLQKHISLDLPKDLPVHAIIEADCILDTAGACFLARLIKILKSQKRSVDITARIPNPALNRFLSAPTVLQTFQPRLNWKIRWLDYIGYHAIILAKTFLSLVAFFGEILATCYRTLHSPLHLRWVSVFHHAHEAGVKALPIVGLISLLIGMVLAYQSINQLSRFGAEIYTVDFLGISILRENAVLLTAIVVAGRSGSAFTAQIGTMALNQEIDAIRMFGLNPILILAIPRIMALLVCLPILVFFSMILSLFGGMVITRLTIDLPSSQFIHQLQLAITPGTFWVGMSKAPLFAILIGLVGSFRGFQVKGSAESVGRMTTQAVVESIFLVMVCDALMSILFSYLKI
jgi:phospholipid/cholesterol/gamma-HCH transport system permease protein